MKRPVAAFLQRLRRAVEQTDARRFWTVTLLCVAATRISAVLLFGDVAQPQLYEYGGIARHVLAGYGYATEFPAFHADYGINPRRVSADATPTAFTLPGGVAVMTVVLGLAGDGPAAYALLYLVNVLCALAAVRFSAAAAAVLWGPAAGRWTAVIVCAYPPFSAVAASFGGAAWYHAVMSLAVLLVLRAGARGAAVRAVVAAAVATALWSMFRGEALGAALLLAAWLAVRGGPRRALLYLSIVGALVSPWIVRNALVFHRFVPMTTNAPLNLWRGNHPGASGGAFSADGSAGWSTPEILDALRATPRVPQREVLMMDVYARQLRRFISDRPAEAAALFARKLAMFCTIDWTDARARHPLFALSQILLSATTLIAGVVLARRRALPWQIAGIVLFQAILIAAMHVETRYQLTISLLCVVLVAGAVASPRSGSPAPQA